MKLCTSIIALIILLIGNTGCNSIRHRNNAAPKLTTVFIDPTKTNSLSDLSRLVADIEFIPLETRPDNLMCWAREIWAWDNKFLMLTGNFEVQSYSRDGKFNFKISKAGKGKDEILWISDISPGSNQNFYILGHLEFYEFDFDGNYIKTHPINLPYDGFNPSQFHIVNNTFQLFSTASLKHREGIERFSLVKYDVLHKKHHFALYMPTGNIGDNVFLQCDTMVMIAPVIGVDTIYYWNYNRVEPKFYIDFGKYKVDRNVLPQDYTDPHSAFSYAQKNKKALYILDPLMNDEWLIFGFFFHNNYYRAYYNKLNKNIIILEIPWGGSGFCLLTNIGFIAVVDNRFVTSIAAHKIHDLLSNDEIDLSFLSKKRQNEILNQLADVKETDNPLLMFVTMKSSAKNSQ